ncbi:hypothetical protein D3C84_978440 [compost metagenome]
MLGAITQLVLEGNLVDLEHQAIDFHRKLVAHRQHVSAVLAKELEVSSHFTIVTVGQDV